MTEKSVFSGPVLAILIAGATAVFALSILLMLTGSSALESSGNTTKSISAIGQAGLYELAQRSGMPVARSRINGIEKPNDGGLLIMAEPSDGVLSADDIIRLGRAANVLLVLPKRWGAADPVNRSWIKSVYPIDLDRVTPVARLVEPKLDLTRDSPPKSWGTNQLGIDPTLDDNAQLIKSDALTPIVGDARGTLIGEKLDGNRRVWILSDPDVIENHGLTKGANAAFVLAMLNTMREGDGKVVFDETIHGMVNIVDNPFGQLFQFPFVIVVLLGLVAAGLLLWATTSRFGQPRKAPPAFDLGKGRLIGNTASLLDRAGHHAFVMRRYIQVTLRDAGRLFHAPRQLNDEELAAWLDIIGEARGIESRSAAILANSMREQTLPALFQATRDIHQWKEVITHGTSARSSNR
jgi:hypothetical protein